MIRLGRTMICEPPSKVIPILLGPCSTLIGGEGGEELDRDLPVGLATATISVIVCDNLLEAVLLELECSLFVVGEGILKLAGKEVIITGGERSVYLINI